MIFDVENEQVVSSSGLFHFIGTFKHLNCKIMDSQLQYPIGQYEPQLFSEQQFAQWKTDIRFLPQHIENAVATLDEAQLHVPYRPDGWTIQQVVHHVADSHMNAYIRFKLALTEDSPIIKPYYEEKWALLSDTRQLPINISITLLHALHARWTSIIENIAADEWDRSVVHPQYNKTMSLWYLLGLYAWHGRHHTAHIISLKERMNWI